MPRKVLNAVSVGEPFPVTGMRVSDVRSVGISAPGKAVPAWEHPTKITDERLNFSASCGRLFFF